MLDPHITGYTVIDSPVGDLTLVVVHGRLVGLYMKLQRHSPELSTFGERQPPAAFSAVSEQLNEYFEGTRTRFDVPMALNGTPFQRRVWTALTEIPYGRTASYGELAARIGRPTASRAVGLANGKNPVGIIVPCHRVIGADGSLTGYGGGLERKQQLLAMERKVSGHTLV
jgi:methylated-DNA-[protein]-cysteine S-methyltransferase